MTTRNTLIALAVTAILAGCSRAQLANMADALCRGLDNCTVYDEDGNPSGRDWKPAVDRH